MSTLPPPEGPGAWPPPPAAPQPPGAAPADPYAVGAWPQPGPQPAPWGAAGAWPAPPPVPETDGMAVTGFVLSLVGVFPAALPLGIVALSRTGPGRRGGRGLAIAAVVIASVQIALLAVLVPLAVFSSEEDGAVHAGEHSVTDAPRAGDEDTTGTPPPADEGGGAPGDDAITVFDIEVGDCFDDGGTPREDEGGGSVSSVTVQPCDGPHRLEAFGTARVTGYDTIPGEDVLSDLSWRECLALVQPYVLDSWEMPAGVGISSYYPEPTGWAAGDREILCLFGDVSGGELTGSLRGDPSDVSTDARTYLEVTWPVEAQMWSEPDPAATGIEELRRWAADMAQALRDEQAALETAAWNGGTGELVADLVAAREASLPHWDAAAQASGPDAWQELITTGYDTLGIDAEIAVREALNLSTGE